MPDQDPRGYYGALELTPSATSLQIREAYRRLSRSLDPDRTTDANAAWKRATVEAAYTVLSDPEGRRGYDAGTLAAAPVIPTSAVAAPPADAAPLRLRGCDSCRSTDQPRHVTFEWVISVVFMTFKNPLQGVYCARCARRTAFFCNAGTSVVGWWGFPWGPIWSLAAIFGNASGGVSHHEATGAINWNNALAFMAKGERASAYAAARQVRGVNMAEAMRLADELRPTLAAEPPDPWKRKGFGGPLTIAAGFAAPILFIALFAVMMVNAPLQPTVRELRAGSFRFAGGPFNWRGHVVSAFLMDPSRDGPQPRRTVQVLYMDDAPYDREPGFTTLRTEVDCTARTVREQMTSVYTPTGQIDHSGDAAPRHPPAAGGAEAAVMSLACSVPTAANPSLEGFEAAREYARNHAADVRNGPTCDRPLRSGAILEGSPMVREGHGLAIANRSQDAAIVSVMNSEGRLLFSFLSLAGEDITVRGIADGDYRIRYDAGDRIGRDCRHFIRHYPVSTAEVRHTFAMGQEGGRSFWRVAAFGIDPPTPAPAAAPDVSAPGT